MPFHQEIIGDDVFLVGAVCWGFQDVSLTELKNGDTLVTDFEGVQIQHSLTASDPLPTLIRGLPSPQAVGTNLEDTSWVTRTTPPNAEQIDIVLFFPGGVGKLTDKGNKRSHTVRIEVRYREVDSGSGGGEYRAETAASPIELEDIARVGFGLSLIHISEPTRPY